MKDADISLSTIHLHQFQLWKRRERWSRLPRWEPTPEQDARLKQIADDIEALAREVIENERTD